MKKIKAVIFDWGGVLIDDPEPNLTEYCSLALNVEPELFVAARNKYFADLQRGLCSEEVFWRNVAHELHIPMPQPPTLWGEAFRKVYAPRPEVFAFVAKLQKNGYHTGLLSNTEPAVMAYFQEQHYDMFESTTFSCAEGVTKPDPAIYKIALAKTGVSPEEVIYFDDRPPYAEAASKLGINGRAVKTVADIEHALAGLL